MENLQIKIRDIQCVISFHNTGRIFTLVKLTDLNVAVISYHVNAGNCEPVTADNKPRPGTRGGDYQDYTGIHPVKYVGNSKSNLV